MTAETRRKTKWVALVTALVSAATPGVYSAWQTARTAWEQRVEARKSDVQEEALAANVEALRAELTALEKSCATQRDLVDLLVRLRAVASGARGSGSISAPAISRRIVDLRGRERAAEAARELADSRRRTARPVAPPSVVRRRVQTALEAAE